MDKQSTRTNDILNDNLWQLMLRLSVPSIIGMSINGINAFVDALFVGQMVGQEALAAISLAFPLTMITNGFAAMIGVGSSSLLSIALGANDKEKQQQVFGTLLGLTLIVSAVLTLLGILFAPQLIAFMGGQGEIQRLGVIYYQIMMAGAFFRIFAMAANMLIRAEGAIKNAMIIVGTSTLLNMIFNPIFIGVFDMGIGGAAWATVLAMMVLSIQNVLYFRKGKASYEVQLNKIQLKKEMVRPILRVGTAAMMLQIMFFAQQAIVFKSLAYYGTDWDIAYMGACYRVIILLALPCIGFSAALQPVSGINYGADQLQRVKKAYRVFVVGATSFITPFWILILFFPEAVMTLMLPEAQFNSTDILNFRMMILTVPFYPVFFLSSTFYQSISNARASAVLVVLRELLLFLPFVLLLPLSLGSQGIYFANAPVNILIFAIGLWMVTRTFRKWKLA